MLYAVVVGGLSAGLFEETARLGGAAILKNYRTWKDMVSFGLGHGLCEVMLIAGIIPMSYFKIIGTLLLAQGKKGVYLGMLSASVLVNILCNMLTIPLWGKMGAAVASVVSYAVAGFVFLGYYLRTYSIPLSAVFVFSPAEKAKLMSKLGAVKRKLGKKKTA